MAKHLNTVIPGQLEIDHERGVIYFHDSKTGATVFRICNLPRPVPRGRTDLDVTHLVNANWTGKVRYASGGEKRPDRNLDGGKDAPP